MEPTPATVPIKAEPEDCAEHDSEMEGVPLHFCTVLLKSEADENVTQEERSTELDSTINTDNFSTSSEDSMQNDQSLMNSYDNQESCTQSAKPNSNNIQLRSSSRRMLCDICGVEYHQMYYLKKHKLTYLGESPYQCATCKQAFTGIKLLNRHLLTHPTFNCSFCSKGYTMKDRVNDYVDVQKQIEVVEKSFECVICKTSFSGIKLLNRHLLTHSLFKCSICGKGFSLKDNLKEHLKVHGVTLP